MRIKKLNYPHCYPSLLFFQKRVEPETTNKGRDAQRDLFQYIEGFYSRQPIHSALGYFTPEQVEKKLASPIPPFFENRSSLLPTGSPWTAVEERMDKYFRLWLFIEGRLQSAE